MLNSCMGTLSYAKGRAPHINVMFIVCFMIQASSRLVILQG